MTGVPGFLPRLPAAGFVPRRLVPRRLLPHRFRVVRPGPEQAARAAPALVRGVLVLALCALGVLAGYTILDAPVPPGVRAPAAGAVVLLLALQLWVSGRAAGPPRAPVAPLVLLAQAGLVLLPVPLVGPPVPGLPGLLVGSLLVTLRARAALPLSAAVLALVAVLELQGSPRPGALRLTLVVLAAVAYGLVVAGLTTLLRLVRELAGARAAQARAAAAEERRRMSRDVHDLLGMSLSAITLKCELTARLLPGDADLSRAQLDEMMVMARRALADVRAVARGVATLSLDEEFAFAEDTLTAVDVRARVDRDGPVPDGPVAAALSAVLREAVTNVLRHSDATWCSLTLRHVGGDVLLVVVNDGAAPRAAPDRAGGHGLRNLTGRVATLGGELQVERDGPLHRLGVRLPLGQRSA